MSIPDGIAKGIIGFVIGAGVAFLGMHFYGPREKWDVSSNVPIQIGGEMPPGSGPPGAALPGGAPPTDGMNAAMRGDAAGGDSESRDLYALVDALELLSREGLEMHLEFDRDQATKIAAELESLEAAKTMTAEEAQRRLAAIKALLTPEQAAAVDAIRTPAAETSEKRLNELLGRLKPAGS